jgi:lysozyme
MRLVGSEMCIRDSLELPIYQAKTKEAEAMFRYWPEYNIWVRASLIDMIYNLGAEAIKKSTLLAKANAGDLIGMCKQMGRFVYGTVNGKKVKMNGLGDRRQTTEELCVQWGRDGHFSAGLKGG